VVISRSLWEVDVPPLAVPVPILSTYVYHNKLIGITLTEGSASNVSVAIPSKRLFSVAWSK